MQSQKKKKENDKMPCRHSRHIEYPLFGTIYLGASLKNSVMAATAIVSGENAHKNGRVPVARYMFWYVS